MAGNLSWEELALNLYGNTPELRRIVQDIRNILSASCALQPQAVFSQDPQWGIRDHWNLLHLTGVVPFRFKANTFNAPIRIVISHGYPRVSPTVFVVPVEGMAISKNHRHVDEAGKCYLPYLHSWTPSSDLLQLMSALSAAFDNNPPVFKVQNPVVQSRPFVAQNPPSSLSPFTVNTLPPTNTQKPTPPASPHDEEKEKRECIRKIEGRAISSYMEWRTKAEAELQKQKIIARELDLKHRELDSIFTKLQTSKDALQTAKSEFDAFTRSYEEKALSDAAQKQQEKTIDEMVMPADVRTEQLMELVADDNAITDTVYWLDKALEQGTIELAVWLKAVRNIHKEQYKKRALIRKIIAHGLEPGTPRQQS